MHILITRSNPVSPDPRVEKIGRALIGAGYSVQALGWDRTGNLPEQETREGLPVYRLPIRAEFEIGLGNLRPLLKWQWGLWRWLLQHKTEFDAIHACDFDTILPAIWLKKFFGKRVVYDIFDIYADMLRQTPRPIVNLLRRAELWAIDRADAVILADEARLKQIRGAHPRRCIFLYNSPEDYPIPRLVEKPAAGEGCALRLSYVGNLQIQAVRQIHEFFILQSHFKGVVQNFDHFLRGSFGSYDHIEKACFDIVS